MQSNEQIQLWNQAAVKILDVRRVVLEAGERIQAYYLPANSFMYVLQGSAFVEMDGQKHEAKRFHLQHGSKGSRLDIEARDEFEYVLLFYRAFLAFPKPRNIWRLEQTSLAPFALQYTFIPDSPLVLLRYIHEMEKAWIQANHMDQLQVKSLFYQFVHELMFQLAEQEIRTARPDPVKQVLRYIHAHYREHMTLDILAEQFNFSSRHLSMQFKQKTGSSPIDYLIQIRLAEARKLLIQSDATLGEIAAEVGYSDVYYFSRIFKKHTGLSPTHYQKEIRGQGSAEDRPLKVSELSIGGRSKRRYIDYENHYQYIDGGSTSMKKRKVSSNMIFIALLSLTMLLSACGAGSGTTPATSEGMGIRSNTSSTSVSSSSEAGSQSNQDNETRTISTVKGDVVVPTNPKRVVVLYLQGDVVALGIKPIGTSEVFDGAAYKNELEGVNSLGSWFEPNAEAVIDLDPDLIIVPSEATYTLLKDIAPTVYIPYEKMTTEERLRNIADIFGKEQEAEKLITELNSKVEIGKQKLADAGILDKTVSIVEGGLKEMSVAESKQYGRGSQVIYEYLGMKAPDMVQQKMDTVTEAAGSTVSMEVLPEYLGDYVFRSVYEGADNLSDNPVWSSVPAVKEGRLIEIDFDFFYYSDVYSINKQLDFVVEHLLNTVNAK
ncbi:helix-turn-helix domain-containing protein [Paenibacillus xylanilyticus]|uniref:helix-turn-helix domain-containing protein n=1 Tax=Paenibacillus xylanilyticus TaxID=248903 RepID=UPI0039A2BB09